MRASIRIILTVVLLAAIAPQAARADDVRFIDPIFDITVTQDLAYGEAENNRGEQQTLTLDLYEPAGDTADDRPVIVWAHGGGFTGGSKDGASIVALAEAFAARGWVTASISYRVRPSGTPGSPTIPDLVVGSLAGELPDAMRDAQHDMQAAVRWFRANAGDLGIDPDRIVVGGISAGASMALETAFNPEDPGDSGNPDQPSNVSAAVSVSGGSDVRRIEAGPPPVAMFHGTHDTTAPYAVGQLTCLGVTLNASTCLFETYIGAGHDLSGHADEIIAVTAAFLCEHALGGCA